jgi:hypothetical protein
MSNILWQNAFKEIRGTLSTTNVEVTGVIGGSHGYLQEVPRVMCIEKSNGNLVGTEWTVSAVSVS